MFSFVFQSPQSFLWKAAFRWMLALLLHAASQHLIGRDQHDADDERNGEGADQTLPHARLLDLLRRAGAWRRNGRKKLIYRKLRRHKLSF